MSVRPQGLGRSLQTRYIPVDARESRLADGLNLLENALIGHWCGQDWTRFGCFVSKRKAEDLVLVPIARKAGVISYFLLRDSSLARNGSHAEQLTNHCHGCVGEDVAGRRHVRRTLAVPVEAAVVLAVAEVRAVGHIPEGDVAVAAEKCQ